MDTNDPADLYEEEELAEGLFETDYEFHENEIEELEAELERVQEHLKELRKIT